MFNAKKTKLLLGLALVLGGAWLGCRARHIPSPPDVEQVRTWTGFPSDFQLQTMTNEDHEAQSSIGKPVWDYTYQNTGKSLVSFGIAVFEHGTLWGTNRDRFPKVVEEQISKMRTLHDSSSEQSVKKMFQIVTLANGRKAYFTVLGFGPGGTGLAGFCYERDYDLLVTEDFDAEDDVPADKRMKNPVSPTNDLPVFFGKVAAFLEAQQK